MVAVETRVMVGVLVTNVGVIGVLVKMTGVLVSVGVLVEKGVSVAKSKESCCKVEDGVGLLRSPDRIPPWANQNTPITPIITTILPSNRGRMSLFAKSGFVSGNLISEGNGPFTRLVKTGQSR